MTTTRPAGVRPHRRWIAIACASAVSVLALTAAATAASATTPTTDETTTTSTIADVETTAGDATTSTEAEATTSTAATTSSTPAGTAAPTTAAAATTTTVADFATRLAAECEGDTGQPLLADALQGAVGADGSNRIVEIIRTCDVEFVGEIDEELGRPTTNVEAMIADPANNVTPNQAQIDLLNGELALYWRITDAWVQSQTPFDTAAPDTAPADTAAVATTQPEETATTEG